MSAAKPGRSPRADLLQGTLDMLVLQTVASGPLHGYGIAQRLRQRSHDVLQVQQGSLYPALHRLEYRKWLKSTWRESDTGRPAKFYSLTPLGRRQLDQQATEWTDMASAIALIMGRRGPEAS